MAMLPEKGLVADALTALLNSGHSQEFSISLSTSYTSASNEPSINLEIEQGARVLLEKEVFLL